MNNHFREEPHARRIGVLIVVASSVLFIALLAILGALSAATVGRAVGSDFIPVVWITLGASVVALAVIVPLVYAIRAKWWEPQLEKARFRRPRSVAFFARVTPQLVDELGQTSLVRGRLPHQFVVTIGDHGLEFWSRRSAEPICQVDGSAVASLSAGLLSIRRGRNIVPTRTLFVRLMNAGRELRVPLPPLGDRGITFASAQDANRILDLTSKYVKLTSMS